MAVSGVGSNTDATAALASASTTSVDSEQRFLKLLVTQLNNQDPLNPLDNAQLTSQLAQMSTVSGIEKLNAALQSLVAQSGSSQTLQAASLIGRTVLVPGSQVALAGGAATPFGIDLQGGADSVKATIVDAAGNVVRTFDMGAQAQGVKAMSWDGKSDAGQQVADGAYTINISATAGGNAVAANALTLAAVASVAQNSTGVTLNLANGGTVGLSSVKQIL
ncbi:flagellar hook assembly protein FlgD [Herminiimonas sp. CN]|uniref:flagellar hook assembly protein FlgD n=1 Tax=Herminiimonas sp. CN TaxID=1349818 RepID=UPI00047404D3|nr:flagellar hook assembly protein FlgD [Herminiimonas sp. CN]